jgi:hypothetical protein
LSGEERNNKRSRIMMKAFMRLPWSHGSVLSLGVVCCLGCGFKRRRQFEVLGKIMPFGVGLHVLIALFFAFHAYKTRQNMYWLFILFMFPLLGSVVYFLAIYLPEIRDSRGVRTAARKLVRIVDPARELRLAKQAFELTPTVDNRLRLAKALLDAGSPEAALEEFLQAANGPFSEDPALLFGMARAQMEVTRFEAAAQTLEKLFALHPQKRQQPEIALLYARSLAACGASDTREAFDAALMIANGPEVKCFYADWLKERHHESDRQKARALYEEVLGDSRYWNNRHSRTLNRPWLQHAKQALEEMEKVT